MLYVEISLTALDNAFLEVAFRVKLQYFKTMLRECIYNMNYSTRMM